MNFGKIILDALDKIGEPATCKTVVEFIANAANVQPKDIKETVRHTLNGGVKYGYIGAHLASDDEKGSLIQIHQPRPIHYSSESESEGEVEMQDGSRHRRGGGKRRRGKRSGSRRRRSSRSRSRHRRRKH